MTSEKTIKVSCFGGGFNTYTEIRTDEHKGQKLGLAICEGAKITEEATDHIESEDAETMTFDFGTVRKDKISALIWQKNSLGHQAVRRVRFSK
jgi:hypothetical protein